MVIIRGSTGNLLKLKIKISRLFFSDRNPTDSCSWIKSLGIKEYEKCRNYVQILWLTFSSLFNIEVIYSDLEFNFLQVNNN